MSTWCNAHEWVPEPGHHGMRVRGAVVELGKLVLLARASHHHVQAHQRG